MHEQSFMVGLVQQAVRLAREQPAGRIRKVVLHVGALGRPHASLLHEAFVRAAQGTPAEEAALEVVRTDDLVGFSLASIELELPDD